MSGRHPSLIGPIVLLVFGCGEPPIPHNEPPRAQIISHYEHELIPDGFTTLLEAKLLDADNGPLELLTDWFVDGELVCEGIVPDVEDVSACEWIFTPGEVSFSIVVSDPAGLEHSDEMSVEVYETAAPEAVIIGPASSDALYRDTPIVFEGIVSDGEDSAKILLVGWSSDVSGELDVIADPDFTGKVYGETLLTEGPHEVTMHVTDTTGKTGSSTVIISVGPPNSPPTCEILTPIDVPVVGEGEFILFGAEAGDVDVSNEHLTLVWTSDIDGQFGQSTPDSKGLSTINAALGPGAHVVTATVTDEKGLSCTDSVEARVNRSPLVNIAQPLEGTTYMAGIGVPLHATIYDYEDPLDQVELVWWSSIDGYLNSDYASETGVASFTSSDLSPGTHIVSLQATDLDGYLSEDTVSFEIFEL